MEALHRNFHRNSTEDLQGGRRHAADPRGAVGGHPPTHHLFDARRRSASRTFPRVYRLAELPPLGELDLVTIAKRVPHGIVCLISALAYHELTTQIPHEVHLAISRTARQPILDDPPLRIFRFSGTALTAGIETHSIEGVMVRVYCPEKTIADCFKFRNKIGFDVAREGCQTVGNSPPRLWRHGER